MLAAIVQARMGSTRLPGKVLADIGGEPMLWHVVKRLRAVTGLDKVLVATSCDPADDPVQGFCVLRGVECFRGSENDVLDRYYRAALLVGADGVVRITGDCPLIDPQVVARVVEVYRCGGHDYVTNTLRYTYPDGVDVEVFSFAALETAWREAVLPTEREHVTPYMRSSGRFRVHNVQCPVDLSGRYLRWTVDEPSDLAFVRAVHEGLNGKGECFGMEDVLDLLESAPELQEINGGIVCNEGFYKSLAGEPPVPARARSLEKSRAWKERARRVVPSMTQTFSKGPTQFVQGVAPAFLERGMGCRVWDVDGNEYIDYAMALGPVILGHDYPAVSEAVVRQVRKGTCFTLPHPLEVELSELLVETVPCAEMVRFGKNGSDATSGAVRAARAYTSRDVIACCGYHGWQDWYIGTTTRDKGIPGAVKELTVPFRYNDIKSLERVFAQHPGQVAAVIMEPVGVVVPEEGFLERVRELTHAQGALLIFDEVVTGFRMALGGAQQYLHVTPDLACLGKAMANGYPLAAVVGRRDIMEMFDEIFFSFTFGGEALSLAAALAAITEMRDKKVVAHLWDQGQRLKDGYNVLAREWGIAAHTECVGFAPRTVASFREKEGGESLVLKSLFQQECLKRGVLFSGGHNISYSHGPCEIETTLRVYRTAMEILADAIGAGDAASRLEGPAVQPVFRAA